MIRRGANQAAALGRGSSDGVVEVKEGPVVKNDEETAQGWAV